MPAFTHTDDDEIERIAAHYRPVHAPERLPKAPRPTLTLHTPSRSALTLVITRGANWGGTAYPKPERVDRVVQWCMDKMLIAHIVGVATAEEPDHAA